MSPRMASCRRSRGYHQIRFVFSIGLKSDAIACRRSAATEEHFQRAIKGEAEPEANLPQTDDVKQNLKQHATESDSSEMQKPRTNRGHASECSSKQFAAIDLVPARGLEPPLPKGT